MFGANSFRAVVVGDAQAGKTSIVQAFIRGAFDPAQQPTVGAVFHTVTREIGSETVILQIWDTAGQERYRSIGPIYYRNAAAAIAVFDVTVADFAPGLGAWIANVRRTVGDPLVIVVGNKRDLLADEADVAARIREFADAHKAECLLASAKTGSNVAQIFDRVFALLAKSVSARRAAAPVAAVADADVNRSCCSRFCETHDRGTFARLNMPSRQF